MIITVPVGLATLEGTVRWRLMSVCLVPVKMEEHVLTLLTGTYHCDCPTDFEGVNCDVDMNMCRSNPCLNGATCDNLPNGYSCVCAPGYTGFNCMNDTNECISVPCMHGTCADLFNSYSCTCETGYSGRDCDIDIAAADQLDDQPTALTGPAPTGPAPTGLPWTLIIIVGAVVVIVLILAVTAIIIVFVWKRRHNGHHARRWNVRENIYDEIPERQQGNRHGYAFKNPTYEPHN